MIETRSSASLLQKALLEISLGSKMGVHYFDRHLTLQLQVGGFVNCRHPSLTQHTVNAVMGDSFADHVSIRHFQSLKKTRRYNAVDYSMTDYISEGKSRKSGHNSRLFTA
jgi:hypothetical protein